MYFFASLDPLYNYRPESRMPLAGLGITPFASCPTWHSTYFSIGFFFQEGLIGLFWFVRSGPPHFDRGQIGRVPSWVLLCRAHVRSRAFRKPHSPHISQVTSLIFLEALSLSVLGFQLPKPHSTCRANSPLCPSKFLKGSIEQTIFSRKRKAEFK